MFADIGYEETETKGLGWISGKVSKINNQNGKFKLPHIGWNEIEFQKKAKYLKTLKNKSHMYFVHSYEFILRINQTQLSKLRFIAMVEQMRFVF